MKFRYYITDTFDGLIKGTNNEDTAKAFAECDDFFVLDSETGMMLGFDEETSDVKEIE